MIRHYAILRESAIRIAEAANGTVEDLRSERVGQEPAFTDRMLGRIAHAMEEYQVKGVWWSAKTLTDRGPRSEESEYGADFVGVLEIDVPGYLVKKGFLAQAKMMRDGQSLSPTELRRLHAQCDRMLNVSPASFVFMYSEEGIQVVPALAVLSADPAAFQDLYSRSISRFYQEHLSSFIGDRAIYSADIRTLQEIRERTRAERLLYLGARAE